MGGQIPIEKHYHSLRIPFDCLQVASLLDIGRRAHFNVKLLSFFFFFFLGVGSACFFSRFCRTPPPQLLMVHSLGSYR